MSLQPGEIVYKVIEEMSSDLSPEQLFRLQSILIKYMAEDDPSEAESETKAEMLNEEYLALFEQAKRVEGLSDRTISKYLRSMERLLKYLGDCPIPSIKTGQIRDVFVKLQAERNCGKSREMRKWICLYH